MNWFQRHLNLTLALPWMIFYLLYSLYAFLVISTNPIIMMIEVMIHAIRHGAVILVGSLGFAFMITIVITTSWFLKRKHRSLWWLLLLGFSPIFPFSFILYLCLKNKTSRKELEAKETELKANVEKEKHGISTTESQEEEYKHSVLQMHGSEPTMTSDEKTIGPEEQMLRGQELLMKSGWTSHF